MTSSEPRDPYADYQARRYLPELDGLRALSIVLVFTTHIDALFWEGLHGSVGVTVFFVLSGYLISTLALREERRRGHVDLVAFYVRRAFRIYPLYVTTLLAYCVLVLGVGMASDRRGTFVDTLPYYVLFLPERALMVAPEPPFSGAWSLGIEEKFYFVWPVLGFVLLAARRRLRAAVVVGAVGLFASSRMLVGDLGILLEPYALIAIGCLLALLLERRQSFLRLRHLSSGRRPLALGLLLVVVLVTVPGITLGGPLYVAFGVPVALFLVAVVSGPSRVQQALQHRSLVQLGRISYAFYLTHNFAINAVQGALPQGELWAGLVAPPLAFAGAVLIAWVLHKTVEVPCIRWGRRLTARRDAEPARTPAV